MADTSRLVELITTIAADPALRDRLALANDADRTAILAELGYPDVTPADVAANAAAFMPKVADELDDEDLEAVAGGDVVPKEVTTTTVGLAGLAAAAGAAT